MDLSWRTPVEIVLPGRPPHEVRNLCRTHGGGWLRKGLHVRVSGDRVRARYHELSRSALPVPLLRGRLEEDPRGTRIVGRLRWTADLGQILVFALAASGSVVLLVVGLVDGDAALVVPALLVLVLFGPLLAALVLTQRSRRAYEERRLVEGLRVLLAR